MKLTEFEKSVLFHALETLGNASYYDEELGCIEFKSSDDWYFTQSMIENFDDKFNSKDEFVNFIESLQDKLCE